MTDDDSIDSVRLAKGENSKSLLELDLIREELLQTQVGAHFLIEMLLDYIRSRDVEDEQGLEAVYRKNLCTRNIALLERLDRYIERVEAALHK